MSARPSMRTQANRPQSSSQRSTSSVDRRPFEHVADASEVERIRRALGLLVDRDPGPVLDDHEAHGDEARTTVGTDGRQHGPARLGDEGPDRPLEPVRAVGHDRSIAARQSEWRIGHAAVVKPRAGPAPRSGCRERRSRHRSEGHEPKPDHPLDPRRARDRGLRQRRRPDAERRRGRHDAHPATEPFADGVAVALAVSVRVGRDRAERLAGVGHDRRGDRPGQLRRRRRQPVVPADPGHDVHLPKGGWMASRRPTC